MNNRFDIKKLVEYSSATAFIIGLLYGISLVIRNSFFYYNIQETEVQILAVLLATGLVGSVLNYILKKHVKKIIEEYVSKQLLIKIVDEEIELSREAKVEEDITNNEDESRSDTELNTVIVPVQRTLDKVIEKSFYECPEDYKFKDGLEYIAFYKKKKIVGYGKLKPHPYYNAPENGKRIFAIDQFIRKEIPHLKKGAFVQNKMYCNIEKLLSANTTDEIRKKLV